MGCHGKYYPVTYYFNTTGNKGALISWIKDPPVWWKVLFHYTEYPNTIVDFKADKNGGQHEWVIELQCKEFVTPIIGDTRVDFTGINFYTKEQNPPDSVYEEMMAAAKKQGIDFFMNQGFGWKRVSQTDCPSASLDEDISSLPTSDKSGTEFL